MWVESQEESRDDVFFQLPIDPPIPLQATPVRWLNQWPVLKERSRPSPGLRGDGLARAWWLWSRAM